MAEDATKNECPHLNLHTLVCSIRADGRCDRGFIPERCELVCLTQKPDALVQAAQSLLDALAQRQREESVAANAHVSHGQKVGRAISRLKRALKEE